MPVPNHPVPQNRSAGGHLVAADPALPLVAAALRVEARGGIARVVCEQRFVNRSREPLLTTYSLPLPVDAAVSGFSFVIGNRRIVGEIDRTAAARDRFEEAIAAGRTAALLEQDRSSLFTQELGNIPPGAEITAEVTLDQRLVWLEDEGGWEWRFPTTVMPRYLGEPGRVADSEKIAQPIADGALAARLRLVLTLGDRLPEGRIPSSPAHPLSAAPGAAGGLRVELASEEGVRLDRDVVVRWPVAGRDIGLSLETARPIEGAPHADAAYGLLTIVPPEGDARPLAVARDLIVLLDTSGSMKGRPLEQAQSVVAALIASLAERDTLELVEFSDAARRWKAEPVHASERAKGEALSWLRGRKARGSTEMREGILAALSPIHPASQRQVVLVTDGAIGFETEVLTAIDARLGPASRLHTLGVGSAVNRSLTAPAARAGRGVEIVLGLDDDPERAVSRLLRRTMAPLVVELEVSGTALLGRAPERLPDLFAGAPVLLGLKLRPEGGDLVVRGSRAGHGVWEQSCRLRQVALAEGHPGVLSLFGRELVEDLELRIAKRSNVDEAQSQIENVGLAFGISTRFTSWVAVAEEPGVDPTRPVRRVRMPHELPHGTSVEGIGLRAPEVLFSSFAGAVMSASAVTGRTRVGSWVAGAAQSPSRSSAREGSAQGGQGPAAGAMGRLRDWLGGKDDREVRVGRSFGTANQDAFTPLRLPGKVSLHKAREIVVSVTAEHGEVEWMPGRRAVVEWADGTTLEATIVDNRTTRPGMVAMGQSMRACLQFERDIPGTAPSTVRFGEGTRQIVVDLEA